MELYSSKTYNHDLKTALESVINIEMLKNTSILITGATGLIGSFLVDILLKYNTEKNAGITVYALGRSIQRLTERFREIKTDNLIYIEHNVNNVPVFDYYIDFIIHAASNAYPAVFNLDPVGTIISNIQGTKYILDYGKSHGCRRMLFVSSGEVYGQGDMETDSFTEAYSGYIDPMQPRSCYPNGKRAAETLCVAYTKQYGLDTVIVRPCHSYGPNATLLDNRANVQFINNALNGKDIVLKSAGNQIRSYCYIADCASAILTVLINGKSNQSYNIANSDAKATIAEYADIIAKQTGQKVIFSNPDAVDLAERTPITKQVLNSEKLESLGWHGKFSVPEGIKHTLDILQEYKFHLDK